MSSVESVQFSVSTAMAEAGRSEWNALAGAVENPCLEWEYLHHLEASGSIQPRTGWYPCHILGRRGGRLVAAAPLYVKSRPSMEYISADADIGLAAKFHGLAAHPRLVGAVPVSPIPGYRFLFAPGEDEIGLTTVIGGLIRRICERNQISLACFQFVDPDWATALLPLGYQTVLHPGFAWHNRGYLDFEDFLDDFRSGQRKTIRRERQSLGRSGLRLRFVEGPDIDAELMRRMYDCYAATNDKYGPFSFRFLNPSFFEGLREDYRHRLLVLSADAAEGEPLGMALFLRKNGQLYGRYWGCFDERPFLHFNVCYYAPMEWAIERGIASFNPGVGGQHKVRRGFEVTPNYSLYTLFHDAGNTFLRQRIIPRLNLSALHVIESVNEDLPLKFPVSHPPRMPVSIMT